MWRASVEWNHSDGCVSPFDACNTQRESGLFKIRWMIERRIRCFAFSEILTKPPHFAHRAKHVIFLFMPSGPSQVDTFDYKPELTKRHEEDLGGG